MAGADQLRRAILDLDVGGLLHLALPDAEFVLRNAPLFLLYALAAAALAAWLRVRGKVKTPYTRKTWRGDGYGLYEAMARPTDAPHRSLFIVVPMVTTAVGGIVSNLLVGPFASVGYMACGWGDAVGEPVGTRWGKHRYGVPSLGGVPAERSLEGSAAVCVVGGIACTLALLALGFGVGTAAAVGAVCGVAGALVEAFSNHGLDNFTIQVAAASVAWMFLR